MKDSILTSNIETEKALLAAIIAEGNIITEISPIVSAEMISDQALRKVYEAIISLYDKGSSIDIITVNNEMVRLGAKKQESFLFLTNLSLKAASGMHAVRWAKEVADRYMRIEFNKLAIKLVQMTSNEMQDIDESLDYLNEQIDQITSFAKIDTNNRLLKDVSTECIALLENRVKSRKSGQKTGIATGIEELDYMIGGFKPKKLVIFAGRPGMGKTSVAVSFAKYAAKNGYPSMIFSLEMPSEEIGDKLLLSECDVDAERYRDGFINQSELDELNASKFIIDRLNLRVDDTTGLSIRKLKSKVILAKKKHKIKLIVIDYIQLMKGSDKSGNREQEISSISRGLKQLAKDLDITVIALSQLNRTVESRADKIPMLSDLRESGAIEQDADIVMFAYRPKYYGMECFPDDDAQTSNGVGRVIIAKHRGGSLGSVYFSHDKAMNKISGLNNSKQDENEIKQASASEGFGDAKIPF